MLDASNPKRFPRAFTDRMYDDFDAGTRRAVLALYRATPDIGAMSERFAQKLAPLALPALVIWGTGDKVPPLRATPRCSGASSATSTCTTSSTGADTGRSSTIPSGWPG